MNESDCLIVLGASFSHHTGITAKKPTVQIDWDPMMLGKFHPVDVPVWGEIGVVGGECSARAELGLVTGAERICEQRSPSVGSHLASRRRPGEAEERGRGKL